MNVDPPDAPIEPIGAAIDVKGDLDNFDLLPLQLRGFDALSAPPMTFSVWMRPNEYTELTTYPNAPYSLPTYRFYELFGLVSTYMANEPSCPTNSYENGLPWDETCTGVGWVTYITVDAGESEGKLTIMSRDGGNEWINNGISSTTFATSHWHHIAIVVAGPESAVYVNGTLDSGFSALDLSFTNELGNNLEIGNRNYPFTGMLDRFQVFQMAASVEDAKKMFCDGTIALPPSSRDAQWESTCQPCFPAC